MGLSHQRLHYSNCDEIPSLGHLKLLRDLELVGLRKVECIGLTFYGGEVNDNASSSSTQAFPALTRLVLKDMPLLTEWKEAELTPTSNGGGSGVGVGMFPKLEELVIEECPLLKTTPNHFEILDELKIDGVDSDMPVLNICSNLTSLVKLSIASVKELTGLPVRWPRKNKQLAELRVILCPKLTSIFPFSYESCLKHLVVSHCEEFRELPQVLYNLHSLEYLEISDCPNFCSIPAPNGRSCLTSLQTLIISECKGLRSIPRGMLEYCPSLEFLDVQGCEKLNSIQAGELRRLTRLRHLLIGPFRIGGFGCIPFYFQWHSTTVIPCSAGSARTNTFGFCA